MIRLPPIGIIEGFYGKPWTQAERLDFLKFARESKIDFYVYAPKADSYLRRRWRDSYPRENENILRELSESSIQSGIEFGVGFSPYEIYKEWNPDTRKVLTKRLELFHSQGLKKLGLFFDDMKGDQAKLADLQVEIAHFVAEFLPTTQITLCPTYYSDDPILDKMFGARPEHYIETLGRKLHLSVDVIWTGPKICSKEYPPAHLSKITAALGRKLWLWDNYPVNDGPRMCPFLHLRSFTGRAGEVAPYLSAHGINPMNQAVLSRIPILTELETRDHFLRGEPYSLETAWLRAATQVTGSAEFAEQMKSDLPKFVDTGWVGLGTEGRNTVAETYSRFPNTPAREEILAWTRGESQVTDAETFLSQ